MSGGIAASLPVGVKAISFTGGFSLERCREAEVVVSHQDVKTGEATLSRLFKGEVRTGAVDKVLSDGLGVVEAILSGENIVTITAVVRGVLAGMMASMVLIKKLARKTPRGAVYGDTTT